jgi:hypothetical protein
VQIPLDITPDGLARQLIANKRLNKHERRIYLGHIANNDVIVAVAWNVMALDDKKVVGDDNIYRVSILPDRIDVVCFGLESIDSCLEGHYDCTDDLPDWVKERLAVLNMIPATPPTQEVEGVGRRISAHVYWVFAPNAGSEASTSA